MMTKTTTLAALMGLALATLVGTAHASPQQQVQVSGAALRHVSEAEMDNVKGRYRMSDGRQLKVSKMGLRVRAELEGEDPIELRAVSANHLVSVDGRMTLRFSGDENVSNVRLTLQRRTAQNSVGGGTVETWTLTSVSHTD